MTQEAQRNPGRIKAKINIPGHIVIKLLETTENEKIINKSSHRKEGTFIYRRTNIRITADFITQCKLKM